MPGKVVRMPLADSFRNFLAGFNVYGRDKALHQEPFLTILNPEQLTNLYRGDWMARKIVDIPAFDACRAWRQWQADTDQIEQLEDEERKFGLQRKLMFALTRARLFGGACLILGVSGTGDFHTELNLEDVNKGSLKFVHVVERWMIAAGQRVTDITSPWYGEPTYYQRSNNPILGAPGEVDPPPKSPFPTAEQAGTFLIHPSRVIRLIGADYPDIETAPDVWGDSVLQPVYDTLKNAGLVNSALGAMISEAKLDIVSIAGLTEMMATTEGTNQLIGRFSNSNVAKSVVNTLLLDKDTEEWNCRKLELSNLDRVMQAFHFICAGAADIPATRLFGREPTGLNSTGESDIRNYYDRISSDQKVRLTPLLSPLDEVLIRHTFGDRDPDIHYNWAPLWQMSDTEKADINFKLAQAHNIDVQAGLINPDVLRIARENYLIEDGFLYPGMEGALDEGDKAGDFDVEQYQQQQLMPMQMPGGAAKPGGPAKPGQQPMPPPGGPAKPGGGAPKPGGGGFGKPTKAS
jgi:hypothetical protein